MGLRRLLPFGVSLFAAVALLIAVVVAVAPAFAEPTFVPAEAQVSDARAPQEAEVSTPAPRTKNALRSRPSPAPSASVEARHAGNDENEVNSAGSTREPSRSERTAPVEETEASSEQSPSERPTQHRCRHERANTPATNVQLTINDGDHLQQNPFKLAPAQQCTSNDNLPQNQVHFVLNDPRPVNGSLQPNQLHFVEIDQRTSNDNLQTFQLNFVQTEQRNLNGNFSQDHINYVLNERYLNSTINADAATRWRTRALSLLDQAEAYINAGNHKRARTILVSVEFHAMQLAQNNHSARDLFVRAEYLAEQSELLAGAPPHAPHMARH